MVQVGKKSKLCASPCTLRDRVASLIAEVKSLEQILAAPRTADFDEKWGQVPSVTAVDLLPIIYQELVQQ